MHISGIFLWFEKPSTTILVHNLSHKEGTYFTPIGKIPKICSLIIDSGSCYNCCSTKVVEKLNLFVVPHPKPYKWHWINEGWNNTVKDHVKVKLFVENYADQVLCDVIPMDACHVLLRRPWQFDKKKKLYMWSNQ